LASNRETTLLLIIELLWGYIKEPNVPPHILEDALRARGFSWALPEMCPHGEDDWLTPDQIADALGYDVSTVRVWAHRYRLPQIDGRYRWGDIRRLGR
jgi:hypothetical protein